MPIPPHFRRLDAAERRHDGPVPPPDPAAPPDRRARARLYQDMARDERDDIARRRLSLSAAAAGDSPALTLRQGRLRFYRDRGAAWMAADAP
jgi:hypothetical protein